MIKIFVNTILPLFAIVIFGYILKKKNIITNEWMIVANKITYYIAIPAVLIKSLTKNQLNEIFSVKIMLCVAVPILLTIFISFLIANYILKLPKKKRATFVHSSIHGNIGYMAYAVAYYALSSRNFHNVVVVSSFLIIFQNFLGALLLTFHKETIEFKRILNIIGSSIIKNPIIISVVIGCALSYNNVKLPLALTRFIKILADMGLPTALFLIGANLIFDEVRYFWKELSIVSILKLLVLPFAGFAFAKFIGLPKMFILPLLILLASPAATVTYVMSSQIEGSPELASANVSLQTLLCAFSYSLVIGIF